MAVAPRREPPIDKFFGTNKEEEVTDEDEGLEIDEKEELPDEDETDRIIPGVEAVAIETLDVARDNEMGI